MEIFYKVTMKHADPKRGWISMDSGDEAGMLKSLEFYRNMQIHREFRLEKHTMEVIG